MNIAARLQERAEPGGICIDDAACQRLSVELRNLLQPMGPLTLKNIKMPVDAWHWEPAPRQDGEPGNPNPEAA